MMQGLMLDLMMAMALKEEVVTVKNLHQKTHANQSED